MRRILSLAAACALLGFVGHARADDTPPDWLKKPTAADLHAVFPREALLKGIGGRAVIRCTISVQGALHDCVVVDELPSGAGFGAAALALTPQFLMKPATHDGKPVESPVTIPLTFNGTGTDGTRPEAFSTGTRIPGGESAQPVTSTLRFAPSDLVVAGVPWLEAPSYDQVVAAYPSKARAQNVGGHVALDCHIGGDGHLAECNAISEQPAGLGFGAAAKALARDFVAPATDADGGPIRGASTQIAVTFAAEMLTGQKPVIGKPHWQHLPASVDVAQAFPAAATAAHISMGRVMLTCTVAQGGNLSDCSVESQTPPGYGFDKAALAVAPQFQVFVWSDEGLPTVGGTINVPLRYEADTGALPH